MKKALYLGTDPSRYQQAHPDLEIFHFPILQIIPRPTDQPDIRVACTDIQKYTHIIFTSKHAVELFIQSVGVLALGDKHISVIGTVTAESLQHFERHPDFVAEEESQEGLVEAMRLWDWQGAHVLMPRSSGARDLLEKFLSSRNIKWHACALYDTVPIKPGPLPHLEEFSEIIFTSPSSVTAYQTLFGELPAHIDCKGIGPVTQAVLQTQLQHPYSTCDTIR